jgi:VanZ family protein
VALLWSAFVVYGSLTPLGHAERVASSAEAAERLSSIFRVPLELLREGEPLTMTANVARKLILFGVFGWISYHPLGPKRFAANHLAMVACGVVIGIVSAGIVEIAQVWLPPHVPDFTDVVLGAVGGGLGMTVQFRQLGG